MFNEKEYNKAYLKKYYRKHKKRLLEQRRKYRLLPSVIKQRRRYGQEYYSRPEVKTRVASYAKEYVERKGIKEQLRKNKHKWNISSKGREWYADYARNRSKEDINYRIKLRLRGRIGKALKGKIKSESMLDLLGCSIEKLREHIASQFKKGMNWKNYGRNGWHIDHKQPCVSFNLVDSKEQKRCFHYTNLQPLWAYDNRVKAGKIISNKIDLAEGQ